MKKFKLNASITDFTPVFSTLDFLFKNMSEVGIDGLEIVLGVKTRWSLDALLKLSKKYNLRINTIHQPMWSGGGLYLDEEIFKIGKVLNIKGITIHPLVFHSLYSKSTTEYFKKLSIWSKKYNVQIFLENMPAHLGSVFKIIDLFYKTPKDVTSLPEIYKISKKYDFLITFDSSHFMNFKPFEDKEFKKIFNRIGNIHLSSFTDKLEHLPLTLGYFDSKGFFNFLNENEYNGQITFEIYYPKLLNFNNFDFKVIKDSVELVRKLGY